MVAFGSHPHRQLGVGDDRGQYSRPLREMRHDDDNEEEQDEDDDDDVVTEDGEEEEEEAHRGRAAALCVAIVLFGSITAAQLVAAIYAHSDALLVDCASMLVDTFTYIGNWFAESPSCRRKGEAPGRRLELLASAFSLVLLYSVTLTGMLAAALELAAPLARQRRDGEDLDVRVVLVFGVLGLILDVAALAAFATQAFKGRGASVNVLSALAHIAADCLRSIATTSEALLVLYAGSAPEKTDSWTTFVVSATIIVGSCGPLRLWLREASAECSSPIRKRDGNSSAYEIIRLPGRDGPDDDDDDDNNIGGGSSPTLQLTAV